MSLPSLFDHPNNISWREEIIKFTVMSFSSPSCYFVPLTIQHSPQHPQSVIQHTIACEAITLLYILKFLYGRGKDKTQLTELLQAFPQH
jgi:hypothetical protein